MDIPESEGAPESASTKPRHLYIFVEAAWGGNGDPSTYHVLCVGVLVVGEMHIDDRLEIARDVKVKGKRGVWVGH